ncbi:MAG TPA: AAA family ATPase [Gemmatimonadales bacterium]|nr:AAA family ATPase [Gemmatimonadales bacterium]
MTVPAATPLADIRLEDALGNAAAPIRLIDVTPKPLAYTVDGLVLARDINAIVGQTGSMKTTVLLHVLAAVACGADVFGSLPVRDPGPVLMLSGEDDRHVIANRVRAICDGQYWNADRVLERFHLWDEGVVLADLKWEARIIEAVRDLGIRLIGGDPLRDIAGPDVDENSNSDAARVNAALRRIIAATGVAVLYTGHVTKPSEGKDRLSRFRGASAWVNATRLAWWADIAAGGLTLTPLKGNRSGRLRILQVKTVIASPDGLNWKAARFDLDAQGDVTNIDVIRVLELVGSATEPPTSRALLDLMGVGKDRTNAALSEAKRSGWVQWTAGARGAHFHSLSEAGKARLLLAGADRG